MLSFKEYLSEANPIEDKKARDEAKIIWNRIVAKIKKDSKSSSPYKLKIFSNALGLDVGGFLKDPKLFGLGLYFAPHNQKYQGAFIPGWDMEHQIAFAVMTPNDPAPITMKIPKQMQMNFLLLSKLIDKNKKLMQQTFMHEFIHYKDFLRTKNKDYWKVGTLTKAGDTLVDYHNDPREVNAHYQEFVGELDSWLKDFRLKKIKKIESSISQFNRAKTDKQIGDALYLMHSMVGLHSLLKDYSRSPRLYINKFENTEASKPSQLFMKNLNATNRKKVLARLYQHFDQVHKKEIEKYIKYIKSIAKKLKNDKVMDFIKTEYKKTNNYDELVDLGIR